MPASVTKNIRRWEQRKNLCSKQDFQLEEKGTQGGQPGKLNGYIGPVKINTLFPAIKYSPHGP